MEKDLCDILSEQMAKEIAEELDRSIVKSFVEDMERKRKRELLDKYLSGEATCQEIEEFENIVLEDL